MEILDEQKRKVRRVPKALSIEMLVGLIALASAIVMIWTTVSMSNQALIMIVTSVIFTACIAIIVYILTNPDTVRAHQTDAMLRMSSRMVDLMASGMTPDVAQAICELLLPSTAAIAVAITDDKTILGYAGYLEAENPQGANIRTQATHDAIADGRARVIYTADEIGLPKGASMIKSAIIVPLKVGGDIRGTLKFYYRNSKKITETQKSIAQGFGVLLATQIAATELEEQRELATAMELKMLQNQINPHFLFNTINTIASFIRTDPMKARTLLREFAVFYRSTLENSQERIPLARELEQTQRYFMFEVARFGEDRLEMIVDIDDADTNKGTANAVIAEPEPAEGDADNALDKHPKDVGFLVSEMEVPPFLMQPLVENAVKHAMPAEGKLTVRIYSHIEGSDVLVCVADDGVGMSKEACENIMHPHSQTGLGIAVKNVHDRMKGFYGTDAEMMVESEIGVGTTVTLRFPGMYDTGKPAADEI